MRRQLLLHLRAALRLALPLTAMAAVSASAQPGYHGADYRGMDYRGPVFTGEVAARLATPWQGTWMGPDFYPNQGSWASDLLAADGRPIGAGDLPTYRGNAFVIIHPQFTNKAAAWDASWLHDCHNKMNYMEIIGRGGQPGSCEGWLQYYHSARRIYFAYAYAIPVSLPRAPRNWSPDCNCETVTTIETQIIPAGRTKTKRLRMDQ